MVELQLTTHYLIRPEHEFWYQELMKAAPVPFCDGEFISRTGSSGAPYQNSGFYLMIPLPRVVMETPELSNFSRMFPLSGNVTPITIPQRPEDARTCTIDFITNLQDAPYKLANVFAMHALGRIEDSARRLCTLHRVALMSSFAQSVVKQLHLHGRDVRAARMATRNIMHQNNLKGTT